MKFLFTALFLFCLSSCSMRRGEPLPVFGEVPQFQLTSQTGQVFDSNELKNRIWVADFIYTTCPGPCPRMTSQMHEVQQGVSNLPDVRLVSFTIDPARDTPAVLAAYAKVHAAAPGRWFFLTGPQPTLQMLDKDAFKLGDVTPSLEHSTRFVLVDGRSQIRGYYDTSESGTIDRLIQDIHNLARENP